MGNLRRLTAVGMVVVVLTLTGCRMGTDDTARGTPVLGMLGASCDADRVTALARAGVALVEVGVDWSRFEPAPQQFDQAYLNDLRARLARCADAGLGVVLTPGFQYAPSWVVDLPDGTYRDQYGNASPAQVPNYVFSATVRDAAERYLDRFAAEFPLDRFAAVRLGTSEAGELGYPTRQFGSEGNGFWAFDDAALTGDGLPAGMAPNPMPGWIRRAVQRLGLGDRVRFVGWVRGEEKAQLLAGARAVAMPSRAETFGIVAVEGFAAATPVVAFAIPALREVVPEGAGFTVEPFDVEAYAQRLLELCTDADLALTMGAQGRKFAAGYDWDVLAAQQAQMYRTAAVEIAARGVGAR